MTESKSFKEVSTSKIMPRSKHLPATTTTIAADSTLGYKLRVLLHDIRNISSEDPMPKQRINQTNDFMYLGLPYFTPQEAECLRDAKIDHPNIPTYSIFMHVVSRDDMHDTSHPSWQPSNDILQGMTVERAVHMKLGDLLTRRAATDDSIPRPPLVLALIYELVFGIEKSESNDKKFLERLRNEGLVSSSVFD